MDILWSFSQMRWLKTGKVERFQLDPTPRFWLATPKIQSLYLNILNKILTYRAGGAIRRGKGRVG